MCGRIFGTMLATVWAIGTGVVLLFFVMLPIMSDMPAEADRFPVLIGTLIAFLVLGAAPACRIVQAFMPKEYHWWKGPIDK